MSGTCRQCGFATGVVCDDCKPHRRILGHAWVVRTKGEPTLLMDSAKVEGPGFGTTSESRCRQWCELNNYEETYDRDDWEAVRVELTEVGG